jgi:23S rRNA pseudouridine1911/1915/1917 synthase
VLLPPQVRGALANLNRQALHAAELGFEHPQTRKAMRFEAPIPQDFRGVLDALRLPAPSHVPQPLPLTKS